MSARQDARRPDMANEIEERGRGGLRLSEGVALVALGVVGVLVAFWVLSSIAGFLWGIVKLVVVVVVVYAALRYLLGRHR
jgi:hypothetical protein